MPAGPLPQRDEEAEPDETPERADESGHHRGQLKFVRDAGDDRDQGVDRDIRERIGQPGHFQKRPGLGNRPGIQLEWGTFVRGGVLLPLSARDELGERQLGKSNLLTPALSSFGGGEREDLAAHLRFMGSMRAIRFRGSAIKSGCCRTTLTHASLRDAAFRSL